MLAVGHGSLKRRRLGLNLCGLACPLCWLGVVSLFQLARPWEGKVGLWVVVLMYVEDGGSCKEKVHHLKIIMSRFWFMHRSKGKFALIKMNLSTSDNFITRQIKTLITTMIRRIP